MKQLVKELWPGSERATILSASQKRTHVQSIYELTGGSEPLVRLAGAEVVGVVFRRANPARRSVGGRAMTLVSVDSDEHLDATARIAAGDQPTSEDMVEALIAHLDEVLGIRHFDRLRPSQPYIRLDDLAEKTRQLQYAATVVLPYATTTDRVAPPGFLTYDCRDLLDGWKRGDINCSPGLGYDVQTARDTMTI